MIYLIDKADLISEQLRKFTSGYTQHIVGQFSNLDFWLNEVHEALRTIDTHKNRFNNLYEAQKNWIEDHGTIIQDFCPICFGRCELSNGNTTLPTFKHQNELNESRKKLINCAYNFLVRCYKIRILTEESFIEECKIIGTSVDLNDIYK